MSDHGRKPVAYPPRLEVNKPDQVIKVIDEKSGELVDALRAKGSSFLPVVYADGEYTVIVGEGTSIKKIKRLKSGRKIQERVIKVSL